MGTKAFFQFNAFDVQTPRGFLAWMGLMVLGLTALSTWYYTPLIEKDLSTRTRRALEAQNIFPDSVTFSGRDGALALVKGSVAASVKEVQKIAQGVYGVRTVVARWLPEAPSIPLPNDADERSPAILPPASVQNAVEEETVVAREIAPAAEEPERGVAAFKKDLEGRRLHFKFNSTDFASISSGDFSSLALLLLSKPGVKIRIVGFTDSTGPSEYNMRLSRKRAEDTARKLIERGVPAEQLLTEGKGESNFIASNETREGRTQNRRVEFQVVEASP